MTKKKRKKKESWKERRRRAALKVQKALEAERLKRERQPKKRKGWTKGKTFAVVFAFLLIIGIYGAWQYSQSSPSDSSQNQNTNRQKAPLFTLTDIDGNQIALENLTGKVVILNFFDTACTWCIPEIEELAKVREQYSSDEVVIISIDVLPQMDTVSVLKQFREQHNVSWPIAQDTANVFKEYVSFEKIVKPGTPTTIIIDKEGLTSPDDSFIGLTEASTLSSKVNLLLSR